MCCGDQLYGGWQLPTCAVGCVAGFDEQSEKECLAKCRKMKENGKCNWTFHEHFFTLCNECENNCKPVANACETGCEHFFTGFTEWYAWLFWILITARLCLGLIFDI